MSERDIKLAAALRDIGVAIAALVATLERPRVDRYMPAPPTSARKGWHPADIHSAIKKRGITPSELSRQHGFTTGAVGQAIKHPWLAVEQVISDFLGVPVEELFADRFTPDGRRIPLRSHSSGDWTAERIRDEVHAKGTTLKALSQAAGLSPAACSIALIKPWERAERTIADWIGVPVETLWPERAAARRACFWSRKRINNALRARGLTLAAVSREHGLHSAACSTALRRPFLRAEQALADVLGVEPQDLFPNRFDAEGRRVRAKTKKETAR